MIVKSSTLMQIECVLGAILYLIGVTGSYFRYNKYERRGNVDALFMVCITWGYCLVMIGLMNILKQNFIPTLHFEVIRVLYYSGAVVSSFVFFTKDFAKAATMSKIGASLLMATIAFIFGEALVFYLDMPYGAAIFSSVGLLVIFYFNLWQQKNLAGILTGLAILLLPIFPKLSHQGFNFDKMNEKREVAVKNLFEGKPTEHKNENDLQVTRR